MEYLEPYVVDQLSAAVSAWLVNSAATGFAGHASSLKDVEVLAELGFAEELSVIGSAEELSVIDSAEMSSVVGRFASSLACRGPIMP